MKLLVADDDKVSCCILEKVLSHYGHEATIVHDGLQAWDILKQDDAPRLVILDWMMPGLSGVELCRKLRLRDEGHRAYVIILTSCDDEQHFVDGFKAGADDYVVKPFGPRQLAARIRAGVRVLEMQDEIASEKEHLERLTTQLSAANEKLRQTALTDALTGLPNRRYLIERLPQEWAATRQDDRALSCMFIDIDHFKNINDQYGHDAGDAALQKVAELVRGETPQGHVACRFGGEEFLVVCPGSTCEDAQRQADHLRRTIETQTAGYFSDHPHPITVSIGVAERDDDTADGDALIRMADEALYLAKQAGRNRVICLPRPLSELPGI